MTDNVIEGLLTGVRSVLHANLSTAGELIRPSKQVHSSRGEYLQADQVDETLEIVGGVDVSVIAEKEQIRPIQKRKRAKNRATEMEKILQGAIQITKYKTG